MENVFTALETLENEVEDLRKKHTGCYQCMLLGSCSEPFRLECSNPLSPDKQKSSVADFRVINQLLFEIRCKLRDL